MSRGETNFIALEPEPPRRCQNCEFWDAGGMKARGTAQIGDCLSTLGDRFTPEWDHVCPAWLHDSTWED